MHIDLLPEYYRLDNLEKHSLAHLVDRGAKQSRNRYFFKTAILVFLFVLVGISSMIIAAPSGGNKPFAYQARLMNSAGTDVADGNYNVTFRIYDSASGGTCLWSARGSCGTPAAKQVVVSKGIFSTMLGLTVASENADNIADNAFPDFEFTTGNYWLGVQVGSDAEMTPRKRLGAVPYTYNTDELDSVHSSNFVILSANNTFTGLNTFSKTPTASTVDAGSLYINPATNGGAVTNTLLGLAVGGSQVARFNAQGDLTLSGNLAISGLGSNSSNNSLVGNLIWTNDNVSDIGSFSIGSGAWTAKGVTGNWVFIASSADGNKLAAVSYGGQIYTSTDSGSNWTARDSARAWTGIASSSDGTKLVATVYNGQIYTSTDSGASWTARDSTRYWRAVTSSADGVKLAAAVESGQIYTSTDSGASWTPRATTQAWSAIASSADGAKLVATINGGQIYTSTDSGSNWTARDSARAWFCVASSSDGTKLVAGVSGGGYLYTSTDSGATWIQRESSRNWYGVASSADGTKLAAAATSGYLYTSTDSGINWTQKDSSRGWRPIASSADGVKVISGVYGGQFYSSPVSGNNPRTGYFATSTIVGSDTTNIVSTNNTISGSSGNAITLQSNAANMTLQTTTSGDIIFNPAGKIGIGTSSPTEKVTMAGGNFFQSSVSPTIKGSLQDATNLNNPFNVVVSGKYAYVVSLTGRRLTIVDISRPSNPVVVSSLYDSTRFNAAISLQVAGKYVYMANRDANNFSIIDVSNPYSPSVISSITDSTQLNTPQAISVIGDYAYITGYNNYSFTVVDVKNPIKPKIVGYTSNSTHLLGAEGLYVSGKYAYVASRAGNRLAIIDISNPASPTILNSINDATNLSGAHSVYVSGKYAYVTAYSGNRLTAVNISNPSSLSVAGSVTVTGSGPYGLYVSGRYAYVGTYTDNRLTVVDISNPTSPTVSTSLQDATNLYNISSVYVSGKYAYVTAYSGNRLTVVDISGFDIPTANIGNLNTSDITVSENIDVGNNLYVRNGLNVGIGGIKSDGGAAFGSDITMTGINSRITKPWQSTASIGTTYSVNTTALSVYKTTLYSGLSDGNVYSYNQSTNTWSDIVATPATLGSSISNLQPYNNTLYATTNGGYVYSYPGSGTTWTDIRAGSLAGNTTAITSQMVMGSNLYAGLSSGAVHSYNTTTWTSAGTPAASGVNAMVVYNSKLYAGLANGDVYSYPGSGTTWTAVDTTTLSTAIKSLEVYNGHIYAGTSDGYVYRLDSSTLVSAGQVIPGSGMGTTDVTSTSYRFADTDYFGLNGYYLFDGSTSTHWTSSTYYPPANVGQDFGVGNEKTIAQFKIYNYGGSEGMKEFYFEGSNNNFSTTPLSQYYNEASQWSGFKTFDVSNVNAYRYYRIRLIAGFPYVATEEIEMYEGIFKGINQLINYNGNLYAAGDDNKVYRYDGAQNNIWTDIGSVNSADATLDNYAMVGYNGNLYVGQTGSASVYPTVFSYSDFLYAGRVEKAVSVSDDGSLSFGGTASFDGKLSLGDTLQLAALPTISGSCTNGTMYYDSTANSYKVCTSGSWGALPTGTGGWTTSGNDIYTNYKTGVGIGSPAANLDIANGLAIESYPILFKNVEHIPKGNTLTTIDSTGIVGLEISIKIGIDGLPVISYLDSTNNLLKVAKCGNAACSSGNTLSTVDSGLSYAYNSKTSLAIGADGLPVISYYNLTNGDLKVAKCGNAACSSGNTLTTVDSTNDIGRSSSITIGTDGLPVISYYDSTNGDLKVAKCGNAACSSGNTLTTVDSASNVGYSSYITIDNDGLPVISYYDNTNGDLKVAKCGNAACSSGNTLTTVDSASNVGYYTSITLSNDGLPVISYYDSTNGHLKVAKCGNAACSSGNTTTAVDSSIDAGAWSSIAIGTDGLPIIAYYDNTNFDLKFAKCGDISCSANNILITLETTGDIGDFPAMAIGTDGLPVIAHLDYDNNDLKLTKCGSVTCQPYWTRR